jgi:RNA polymerase sigma factor (sigma-70 family)
VRVTRDLDLAEECVQDAYERALASWRDRGIPERPGAWLTTVARRRGLDLLRRDATAQRRMAPLVIDEPDEVPDMSGPNQIPDDRLRLICTCCHPALASEAQVALTLRLVCGLSTVEVARAFLVSEPTMAARLTRAKKKISAARIPYRVPPADELPARVGAVLSVVHLLFTTGHTSPVGSDLIRRDLVERAIDLARMLHALLPGNADVTGLLALILLTDARRATRVDEAGRLLLLEEQDRSQWDREAIRQGVALVDEALEAAPAGRYALQAAMAAAHAVAPTWEATDWPAIVALYDRLGAVWPSPVVALNRAVAVGMAHGPAAGLLAVDAIRHEPRLAAYGYLPATRAEWLRRLGRLDEAGSAYEEAIALTDNAVEREFLVGRRDGLGGA